jgi:hypothetical protein
MLGSVKRGLACVAFLAILSACRDGVDASPEEAVPLEENTAASSPEQSDSLKESNQMPGSEDPSEDGPSLVAVAERAEGKAVLVDEHVEETVFELVDEARPPRDLSAELNAAVGNPIDCTRDFERASPTTIRVTISGLVRPSGAVVQAVAEGTGLSPQARHCIARRVEAVVLKPLEDPVSQRVSSTIEIEYEPPTSTMMKAKVGAPDPELRKAREPLPKRPEVAPSGRPIQAPTSRPIQEPTSRPIQEPSSRRIRGPEPRPIDGWDVDESSKDWR